MIRSCTILSAVLLPLLWACSPADEASSAGSGAATEADPDPLVLYAPGADRADVVGTLQLLFDALETGNAELLRSAVEPSVVMRYARVQGGEATDGTTTVEELAESIESSEERLIERMWDPVVLVNGPLATVWTPYDFYVGDTFSHCGIDTATLLRTDDGWKITGLSWSALQPPACELHPEGPPA